MGFYKVTVDAQVQEMVQSSQYMDNFIHHIHHVWYVQTSLSQKIMEEVLTLAYRKCIHPSPQGDKVIKGS
jgi:hypothetical protein